VRTFIDFMAAHFARMNYEQGWTGCFGVTLSQAGTGKRAHRPI